MDAALSAADAGGLAVTQEHDVAVAGYVAAQARELNATVAALDAAVVGGDVAAAAGKFPPPYHIPASINTPHGAGIAAVSTDATPPTDRGAPSVLLLVLTPGGQVPQADNVFLVKKDWMISISAKEREAANFYN